MNIERNGQNLDWKESKIQRGENKGSTYHLPEVNESTLDNVITWLGRSTAADMLAAKLRLWAWNWHKEATNDDGIFSPEEFATYVRGLSAKGESMADLDDQIEELLEQFTNLSDDDIVEQKRLATLIKQKKAAKTEKKEALAATKAAKAATAQPAQPVAA